VTTQQSTTKPATTAPPSTTSTRAPPSGDCDQVRLTGPYPEDMDYDGVYIKTGEMNDGFPVWKHEDQDKWLFFGPVLKNDFNSWAMFWEFLSKQDFS